jgi:hypothetical protein
VPVGPGWVAVLAGDSDLVEVGVRRCGGGVSTAEQAAKIEASVQIIINLYLYMFLLY